MKAISIRQPWASLICSGVKDVENRSWQLKSLPVRLLIHAGAKREKLNEDNMPFCWAFPLENAQLMGAIGDLKDVPVSAVIGVATVERCDTESESIWAQEGPGAEYKWVMTDVALFKEPILNVKGKLTVFDIPEIDENNLPELITPPRIVRDNDHLTIPLAEEVFDQVSKNSIGSVEFNLDDANLHLFANDDLEELETATVTFTCGDKALSCDVDIYEIYMPKDEETDEPVEYEGPQGQELTWYKIEIGYAHKKA